MIRHREQQFSPYSAEQLFALVADVEKYPAFLPWCRAARILENSESEFLAELVISFAHLSESYISRVKLSPNREISVNMVHGPFEYLHNEWLFTATDNGTMIDFEIDFKFRSRILEKLIGPLFQKANAKMVAAFKKRADELYG